MGIAEIFCAAALSLGIAGGATKDESTACKYMDHTIQSAERAGVDPALLVSLIFVESNWSPRAKSGAGACGLTQIIPKYTGRLTPKKSCEEFRNDPLTSISHGAIILDSWIKKYGRGNVTIGLCGYNAGYRCKGDNPNPNGMRYAKKVLRIKRKLSKKVKELKEYALFNSQKTTPYVIEFDNEVCNDGLSREDVILSDPRMSHTVITSPIGHTSSILEEWTGALSQFHLAGTTYMGRIPGNGYHDSRHKSGFRNSILYVPPHVDWAADVHVIMFYHGLGGYNLSRFKTRIVPRLKDLNALGENFVFVYPEMPWSKSTTTPRGRQSYAWTGRKNENLKTYFHSIDHVIKAHFGATIIGKDRNITMIGHSAGGGALRSAARSKALLEIDPGRIIMSDAGYGTWTDSVWDYFLKQTDKSVFILLVRKWDTPHKNTVRFLKRFKDGVPDNVVVKVFDRKKYTHGDIGDESILWSLHSVTNQK